MKAPTFQHMRDYLADEMRLQSVKAVDVVKKGLAGKRISAVQLHAASIVLSSIRFERFEIEDSVRFRQTQDHFKAKIHDALLGADAAPHPDNPPPKPRPSREWPG